MVAAITANDDHGRSHICAGGNGAAQGEVEEVAVDAKSGTVATTRRSRPSGCASEGLGPRADSAATGVRPPNLVKKTNRGTSQRDREMRRERAAEQWA